MHASFKAPSRVAPVTLTFWIIKILSTGMGETGADYLDHKYPPVIVVLGAGLALMAALLWQLGARRYSAIRYWVAVIMVSVFGTLVADAVHVLIGVPYWVSTGVFTVALIVVFWVWWRLEGIPDMSQITTTRRELIYWGAVMVTFALGTAAGDWMAFGLGFGFLIGTIVFTVGYLFPLWLGRAKLIPVSVAFWLAYTFTRPMGASFADWLALPHERGGLGFGTLPVTAFWTLAIVVVLVTVERGGKSRLQRAGTNLGTSP
jgi:uncharacterized membrane-anchored protein